MAEGGGLLNRCTSEKAYRGFESHSLRFLLNAKIGGSPLATTHAKSSAPLNFLLNAKYSKKDLFLNTLIILEIIVKKCKISL